MDELLTKVKIHYSFKEISQPLQEDIKDLIVKNIKQKLDRYLNKIFANKDDAEILINIMIKKNKQWKYEWSFRFNLDKWNFIYTNDVPFKNINDLVNHAFDRLKEQLSKK